MFIAIEHRTLLANSERATFTLRYETPVVITGNDIQGMVNAAMTEWVTHKALFCADQALSNCVGYGYEREESTVLPGRFFPQKTTADFVTTVAGAAGTAAGQSLPPQNSVVCSLRTNQAGRRALGRVFLPPPPESVVDAAGVITGPTTFATMVKEIAEAVEASIIPVDVDHIVHSMKYGSQAEVVTYTAGVRVDTQRRRLARTG